MHNRSTTTCNQIIIPHIIIKYPNTTLREEIKVDTEVEDEVGEDLDEVEDQ
jgi:hypothetical protein